MSAAMLPARRSRSRSPSLIRPLRLAPVHDAIFAPSCSPLHPVRMLGMDDAAPQPGLSPPPGWPLRGRASPVFCRPFEALELGWFRGTAQTACLPHPPGCPPRALPDPQREAMLSLDDLDQATFLGHLAALPYRTFLATRIQSASAESAVRRHLRLQPPAPGILPAPWAAHPDPLLALRTHTLYFSRAQTRTTTGLIAF